ncbi:MAG: hypothetical protein Q9M17_03775 [Mariprofundus sp.]|nr:hypothetical protein [Mariprofundus sp.]
MKDYICLKTDLIMNLRFAVSAQMFGLLLAFGASLTYSIFMVGSGEVIPKVGAKRFTAYAMIISCLGVIIQFGLLREVSDIRPPVEVYVIKHKKRGEKDA